ncbi:hypothetical protein ACIBM4_14275 [Streptomyces sp. NPDC050256]|uniref:hypothetical protein n=1 Tax=Streptomyces sp. NPDC050256 TaxID=3365607 RepID=UPI00378974C4
MALHLGELVGTIRADDSGWRHGLQDAQLRLAGFTRMADGTLRDMHGRVHTQADAMGQTLGARISRGATTAVNALKKIGPAAAGMAVGVPATAALTTALGSLAAGAVAAGLAVGAFKAAVQPQLEGMKEAAGAAEKADEAHQKVLLKKDMAARLAAKGGDAYKKALTEVATASKAAKEADAAAATQMKGLPPATRATATAFAGLKGAYKTWSDSLASTTMPVLTKGIGILRQLLPALTPFVKAAAEAFGGFLDRVAVGVKGAGFKQWAADMAKASGGALSDFLNVIANLGKGFMGMLQAFLPVSAGVTGGLATMTGAFGRWGAGLKDSEGFAQFVELAKAGGKMLGTLAQAALKVVVALSPIIGVTALIATWIAKFIGVMDPSILSAIGTAWAALVLGLKMYALYGRIVAAATRAWATAQAIHNAVLMVSPIGWIILGIVALIAVIVLIATKTTWFQTAWKVAWEGIKTAALAVWEALKIAFSATIQFFVWQWQVVSGAFSAAWNAVWNAIKTAVETVWTGIKWVVTTQINAIRTTITNVMNVVRSVVRTVWGWIKSFIGIQVTAVKRAIAGLSSIVGQVRGFFGRMKDAAVDRVTALVAFVRGIPGKVKGALGDLGNLLVGAGRSIIKGLITGISNMVGTLKDKLGGITNIIPDWKGPMSVDLRLLAPSGQALMSGLMTGIDSQLPALQAQLTGVTRSISNQVQTGQRAAGRSMAGLVTPPRSLAAPAVAGGLAGAAAQPVEHITRVVVDVQGGSDELVKLIRQWVRVKGRGSVQTAFGQAGR